MERAGAIPRLPAGGGATDSLAPYVVGALAAGSLAGLGLKIRDALTYLGLVLSGAWTLVDIWQAVRDDRPVEDRDGDPSHPRHETCKGIIKAGYYDCARINTIGKEYQRTREWLRKCKQAVLENYRACLNQ